MLISLSEDMTPIEFGFTRLKVKVTRVTCKNANMVFGFYIENYLSQSFHISHADGVYRDNTPIELSNWVKGHVQKYHFCKKMFSLIIFITVYHKGFIFYMLFSLGEGLTLVDFGFFKSRVKVTMVTFVKNGFQSFLRTIYHRAYICNILIALSKTP